MRPRRPRILTGDEARLWGEIAKLVTPLRGRARPASVPAEAAPVGTPPTGKARTPSAQAASRDAAETQSAAKMPDPSGPATRKRARKLGDLAPAPVTPRRSLAAKAGPMPPASGLERRERIGLSRGTLPIESRIDLHGMRQVDAHSALIGFLMRARQAGHARVLVVTGKGSDEPFSERGVLRRAVPHWLRGGELRALVLGFEEAARHHGGAGALYVRLRRR